MNVTYLFFHWLGDFFFQFDTMALKKSHSFKYLVLHSVIYAVTMAWATLINPYNELSLILIFGLFMFASHVLIDGVFSRIEAALWKAEQRHWFFVMIGVDQLFHYVAIIYALDILYLH